MSKKVRLAELQLAIMQALWNRGRATVAEVREDLMEDRPLAHTTIATMLTKMEAAGYVEHEVEGRANVYQPLIEQFDVTRSMVSDLTRRLFQGDVTLMVAHLLADSEVTQDEVARLKKLVREKEKELQNGE